MGIRASRVLKSKSNILLFFVSIAVITILSSLHHSSQQLLESRQSGIDDYVNAGDFTDHLDYARLNLEIAWRYEIYRQTGHAEKASYFGKVERSLGLYKTYRSVDKKALLPNIDERLQEIIAGVHKLKLLTTQADSISDLYALEPEMREIRLALTRLTNDQGVYVERFTKDDYRQLIKDEWFAIQLMIVVVSVFVVMGSGIYFIEHKRLMTTSLMLSEVSKLGIVTSKYMHMLREDTLTLKLALQNPNLNLDLLKNITENIGQIISKINSDYSTTKITEPSVPLSLILERLQDRWPNHKDKIIIKTDIKILVPEVTLMFILQEMLSTIVNHSENSSCSKVEVSVIKTKEIKIVSKTDLKRESDYEGFGLGVFTVSTLVTSLGGTMKTRRFFNSITSTIRLPSQNHEIS